MADPRNLNSFSPDDKRVIEDLVKKQATDFLLSCDKACELFQIVATKTEFEEDDLSSLVQYKAIAQVGGILLSRTIKRGGKPSEIMSLLRYQQRDMLVIAVKETGVTSPPVKAFIDSMKEEMSLEMIKAHNIVGELSTPSIKKKE